MEGLSVQHLAVATIAFLGGVYIVRSRTASRGRRPPGPPGLPLLGNVLQVPGKEAHRSFHIFMANVTTLIQPRCIGELANKAKPTSLGGSLLPDSWRRFEPAKLSRSSSSRRCSTFPISWMMAGKIGSITWIEIQPAFGHRVSASMVLTAAFGLHCPTGEEPDLKEVIAFVSLCTPSASIINVLPFLDIIPGPMPWRKRAQTYRKREDALYDRLITDAVSGKASGMNTWAAAFAREDKPEGDQRRLMNQLTARETDAIVGQDRLPSFKDRPRLPYVEATVRAG
ncbi:hypothetical protein C8J57DRAFT_1658774 [Mycena rebaudengoi]|nr:hypothetical protein C8J57DRAFT_1658774 [Mycena rebaudengoi]